MDVHPTKYDIWIYQYMVQLVLTPPHKWHSVTFLGSSSQQLSLFWRRVGLPGLAQQASCLVRRNVHEWLSLTRAPFYDFLRWSWSKMWTYQQCFRRVRVPGLWSALSTIYLLVRLLSPDSDKLGGFWSSAKAKESAILLSSWHRHHVDNPKEDTQTEKRTFYLLSVPVL
jgi:hypothetical protein